MTLWSPRVSSCLGQRCPLQPGSLKTLLGGEGWCWGTWAVWCGQACRRDGSNWPWVSSPSKLALPVAMETEFPESTGQRANVQALVCVRVANVLFAKQVTWLSPVSAWEGTQLHAKRAGGRRAGGRRPEGRRPWTPEGEELLAFLKNPSTKGVGHPRVEVHRSGVCSTAFRHATQRPNKDNKNADT